MLFHLPSTECVICCPWSEPSCLCFRHTECMLDADQMAHCTDLHITHDRWSSVAQKYVQRFGGRLRDTACKASSIVWSWFAVLLSIGGLTVGAQFVSHVNGQCFVTVLPVHLSSFCILRFTTVSCCRPTTLLSRCKRRWMFRRKSSRSLQCTRYRRRQRQRGRRRLKMISRCGP